jgi:hypothetical protein
VAYRREDKSLELRANEWEWCKIFYYITLFYFIYRLFIFFTLYIFYLLFLFLSCSLAFFRVTHSHLVYIILIGSLLAFANLKAWPVLGTQALFYISLIGCLLGFASIPYITDHFSCVAYSPTMKIELAVSSEALVNICQATQPHIPEDSNVRSCCMRTTNIVLLDTFLHQVIGLW